MRVRDVRQVRALANPLRIRLLEAFAETPRTTKQVANLLGEKPTRLYHHVDALEKAGFLRLHSTRQNRGTIEKYYEAVARRIEVESSVFAGASAGREEPAAALMARTVLDSTRDELLALMRSPGSVVQPGREPIVGKLVYVSGRAGIDAFRTRVAALLTRAQRPGGARPRRAGRRRAAAETERWALMLAFYPLGAEEE